MFIVRDLWQVHYKTLLIIPQKEFIKFNVKFVTCCLEYKSVNENLIGYKCLSCNKNYSNRID